jgi:hypothetical protein
VAAGTSNSTPYYSKYSAGFVEEHRRDIAYLNLLQLQIPLSSFNASVSKAAGKKEMVCSHWRTGTTHLNSMTSVPTKLATLMPENAMENSNTTPGVVRLKSTRVRMNFKNAATVATSLTRPYTTPPNISGGTSHKPECRTEPAKEQKVEIQKRFLSMGHLPAFPELTRRADRTTL